MNKNKMFLENIIIINLLLTKLLLLKSVKYNINKYLYYVMSNIKNGQEIKQVLDMGISPIRMINYLIKKANAQDIEMVLNEYEIKNIIDIEKIKIILTRNLILIDNYINKLNLYLIFLTTVIYLLPPVLFLFSFFFRINIIIIIFIPIILSIIIIKKIIKLKKYEIWKE